LQGESPVSRGRQSCRTAARSSASPACTPSSTSYPPHALPVSGQSSVVHVSLCRCVSCALCENLRAPCMAGGGTSCKGRGGGRQTLLHPAPQLSM
jgi:hypothetical protein